MSAQTNFDAAAAGPFTPTINLDNVAPGATFQATWRFTNTGSTSWDGRYQFVYTITPHDETAAYPRAPLAAKSAYAITELGAPPTVAPGDAVQLTLTFTAPNNVATHATNWQLQAPDGRRFGPVRWMRLIVQAAAATSPDKADTADFNPGSWRSAVWAITSVFESGRPHGRADAYQNADAGIVSYGKHQATLQSGNLERVLNAYFQRSASPASQALQQEYAARVKNKEESLRHDARFKQLLLDVAKEPEMSDAQDDVFERNFYQPIAAEARRLGVRTPLGVACLYDTRVQGGLQDVVTAVSRKLGVRAVGETGPTGLVDEPTWLRAFLDEREARLNRLADRRAAENKHTDAQWLRTSTFRVTELRQLLNSGNLKLAGEFTVRDQRIQGLREEIVEKLTDRMTDKPADEAASERVKGAVETRGGYIGPRVAFVAGIHGPGDAFTWHSPGFQAMIRKLGMPVKFMSDGDRFRWYKEFRKPALDLVRVFWSPDPNRRKTAQQAWEEDMRDGVMNFYNQGARHFEVHNEPRLPKEGMGKQWKNGAEFGDFLRDLMSIIKKHCPEAKLWYPGESPGVPWTDQFAFSHPAYQKVADLCYGVCQHAYSGNTTNVDAAVHDIVDQVRQFHGALQAWDKPIIVSECSVNRAAAPDFRAKVYTKVAQQLAGIPGVQGVFWYVSHWNAPPDEIANAESWYDTDLPNVYKRLNP